MKMIHTALRNQLTSVISLLAFGSVSPGHAAELALQVPASTVSAATSSPKITATSTPSAPAVESYWGDYALKQAVPRTYPRPASEWQSREKAQYQKILSAGKFDVLVLPCQVRSWAFDRATRLAMTAELTAAVARSQKGAVPDPYLVSKALGMGQRELNDLDTHRLANAMGAKTIVSCYAGHDRKGHMSLDMFFQERTSFAADGVRWVTKTIAKHVTDASFNDETPPIEAYEALLPDITKSFGLDFVPPVVSKADMNPAKLDLSASPGVLIASDGNAARAAYTFLLFQALTPLAEEVTKEQFTTKALMALARMPQQAPEYRVLRARTYMNMGYRLAAIKVLGAPKTDEERELLAVLNGNLPEVRAMAAKEKNPFKRMLEKLDVNQITAYYSLYNNKNALAEVSALGLPGEIWPFLARRAFVDVDIWTQDDNSGLKVILDRELPVENYSLKDIMTNAASLGKAEKMQTIVDLSIVNHGKRLFEENTAQWCCKAAYDRPGKLDYLALIQAIGNNNLMRHIYLLGGTQGLPDQALAFVNSIDSVYKGYPAYAIERAILEQTLANSTSGAEKEGLLKSAYENAFNAMYWEQSQSNISNNAQERVRSVGLNSHGNFGNFYYTDIPFHPNYWTWTGNGESQIDENNAAALKNATVQLKPLSPLFASYRLLAPDDTRAKDLLKSIEGRFIGAPYVNELFAWDALQRGNLQAAQNFYRTNIQLSPSYWKSYKDLGNMLMQDGDVERAGKLFLSFPGFAGDTDDRVLVANEACQAGLYFFQTGNFDTAKELFEISAKQDSGSNLEMSSALHLKLLAGDIDGAFAGYMQSVQRYKDFNAHGNALTILHVKDRSKAAWEIFTQLIKEHQNAPIWGSALVGQRRAARTLPEVSQWFQQKAFKSDDVGRRNAAIYLLQFSATDRTPSQEIVEVLNTLDRPAWQIDGENAQVVGAPIGNGASAVLGPDSKGRTLTISNEAYAKATKHRVQSDLAYFAQAYRALKAKDYATAKSIFDEAAKLYDMAGYAIYMVPYYAWSAAKAGDTAGIVKILDRLQPTQDRFDLLLARAILQAAAGNSDDALKSLQLARYHMHSTVGRPLSMDATLGEISELIAQSTGNEDMRKIALDWAQKSRKIAPWQSWSYTLEASLTKNPAERQRALGMAWYLDPQSERLSGFRQAEIDEAVKTFKGQNPFLKQRAKAENDAI